MSRRGLSLGEKRSRMMDVFFEKKDVFQLKELEKIGPQEKGVVMQSVKDVVQSLADDGMIDSEKIGTSQYFWAFPSKVTESRKRKLGVLDESHWLLNGKNNELGVEAKRAKLSRNDTEEREAIIRTLTKLRAEKDELKGWLAEHVSLDPKVVEKEAEQIQEFKEHANRWTTNIMVFQKWLTTKFLLPVAEVNQQFGIPEDLDHME